MRALWTVPVTVALDQASKYAIANTMVRGSPESVLGDLFRLTYIHNRGAAFGLDIGSPILHTLASIVALGVVVWLLWTCPPHARLLRFALTLVVGGALGNMIDRFRLGEVIDFLDVGIGTLRWPIFNLADSFVTVGIVLLAVGYSRQKPDRDETPPTGDSGPDA